MTRKRGEEGGLFQIRDVPMVKTLAKKYKPATRAQLELAKTAAAIREKPDAAERAFMARQLVICTLPHSDPGDVPRWVRRTGNSALVLQAGWDAQTDTTTGYPFGILPRLLLFWIITEAIQTQNRRLVLGRSLAEFMREVGLNPNGGGKRSDHKRLKDQMRRLFKCHISFQATGTDPSGAQGEHWQNMEVAPEGELWWHPHPEQAAFWESWIELGEKFFQAIIASAVPIDMRVLRAIKSSALALDLYALICFRAFKIVQNNERPQFIAWSSLMHQLGTDYGTVKNFAAKARAELRKINTHYPGLTIGYVKGGFTVHATRLAVSQKPSAKSLG